MTAIAPLRGSAAVRSVLAGNGVDFELVEHDATGSALADAHVYGAPPRRVIKTVAIRTGADGHLVTVALPASEHLYMARVRQLLDDHDAQLATEDDLARELPELEPGALPPFGAPAPPLALIDRRVLSSNWVLANGGDHRHSVRLSPLAIVRLSPQARVVDIAEY